MEVALVISSQVPVFLSGEKKQKKEKLLEHVSTNINYNISLAILKKSSVVINWSQTWVPVGELKVTHVI